MFRYFALFAALSALLLTAACGGQPQQNQQSQQNQQPPANQQAQQVKPLPTPASAERNNKYKTPPAMSIDPKKTYTAKVNTTKGSFTIELFAQDAPKTVNNFVFLAREKFYDGVRFHRIMKGFMIQTGDPLGTGVGGPGYRFEDELPVKGSYEPGIVAMANAGPNTNGSQFFICNGPDAKSLDRNPNYTQFGKVIEGMETIQAISNTPVAVVRGEPSYPLEDIQIQSIEIIEK